MPRHPLHAPMSGSRNEKMAFLAFLFACKAAARGSMRLLVHAILLLSSGVGPAFSAVPNSPSGLTGTYTGQGYLLEWTNPSTNTDGSALTEFGGIKVYRNGSLLATLARPRGGAGNADAFTDNAPPLGLVSYQVSAYDRFSQTSSLSAPWTYLPPQTGTPAIDVVPDSLTFTFVEGSAGRKYLYVHNTSGGQLQFNVLPGDLWLTASPSSGSLLGGEEMTVAVDCNTGGFLPPGTHTSFLTVVSNDTTQAELVIPVRVDVTPEPPAPPADIQVTPTSLVYSQTAGQTIVKALEIRNTGEKFLTYALSLGSAWLQADRLSGNVAGPGVTSILLTADAASLSPGTFADTVVITSNDPDESPLSIPVTLTVNAAAPNVTSSPSAFPVTMIPDVLTAVTLNLGNISGTLPLDFNITEGVPWLSVSPASGVVPQGYQRPISLDFNSAGLAEGVYTDSLIVDTNDPDSPRLALPVTLTIVPFGGEVNPLEMTFNVPWNGPPVGQPLQVTNTGATRLYLNLYSPEQWVTETSSGYVDPGQVRLITVSVNPDQFPVGTSHASIKLDLSSVTGERELIIPVHMNVLATPPEIQVSPAQLSLERTPGSGWLRTTVALSNSGYEPLNFNVSESVPWLSVDPPAGQIPRLGMLHLVLNVNADGLSIGNHAGTFRVTTNDPDRPSVDVSVNLAVKPEVAELFSGRLAIGEMLTACGNGDSTVQYVELKAVGNAETWASSLGLRIVDRNGNVAFDQTNLFAGMPDGSPWAQGTTWLLGTSSLQDFSGLSPDAIIPVVLDRLGGVIVVYDTASDPQVLHQFAYGSHGGVNAPAPGRSLELQPDGMMREKEVPGPVNSDGATAVDLGCLCPENIIIAGHYLATRASAADTSFSGFGSADAGYDLRAGTAHAGGSRSNGQVTIKDIYYVTGPTAGTPLECAAVLKFQGVMCADYTEIAPRCSGYRVQFREGTQPAVTISDGIYATPTGPGCESFSREILLPIRTRVNEPFTLQTYLDVGGCSHGGYANVMTQLEFIGLPPGATIESCQGLEREIPVPVEPMLVQAVVEEGRVRLTWAVSEVIRWPVVQRRRAAGTDWTLLGTPTRSAADRVTFIDGDVVPGEGYHYRLADGDHVFGEILVQVPPEVRDLALSRIPAAEGIAIAFTLLSESPARLELFDVQGRAVVSRQVESPGAGTHELQLTDGRRLASGLYFVRLTQDGRSATLRVVNAR
jgi:hypothetical protein